MLTSSAIGGTSTITVTHKSTGVSVNKEISVADSSIVVTDGIYTIKPVPAANDYLFCYTNSVGIVEIENEDYKSNPEYGNFVWYIKRHSATDNTYLIYSMSEKDSNNESNQVLTYSSSLSLASDNNVTDAKLWKFYGSTNNVSIQNQLTGTYLTLSNGEPSIAETKDYWSLNAKLTTEEELLDHCYQLVPVNYSDGKEVIYVINDGTDNAFSGTLLEDGVKMWNGITDNINIYMSDEFDDSDKQQAIATGKLVIEVDVTLYIFQNDNTFGEAHIYTPSGTKYELDEVATLPTDTVFASCEILLDSAKINGLGSYDSQMYIIGHEMGHLLTLRHKETTGGVYNTETSMLSIMNYDLSSELDDNATYTPSWLDIHNIIQKWG